jgi:hypothetical protein
MREVDQQVDADDGHRYDHDVRLDHGEVPLAHGVHQQAHPNTVSVTIAPPTR